MTSSRTAAPGRRDSFVLGGAALVLTLAAAVVGTSGWPSPDRTSSGWQVADVPTSLLALLVGAGLLCLSVAAVLARPWQLPVPTATVWWLFGLIAVFAHGWNNAYLAALADPGGGAIIPVFAPLFTLVPALVVVLAAIPASRAAQLRAGLGTAVVGVPLSALGWALYAAPDGFPHAALSALWATALFGVLPVVLVLAALVPHNPRISPTG